MMRPTNNRFLAAALTCALLLVAAACSSNNNTSGTTTTGSPGGGSGSGRTYTIGVITDLTGPASSEFGTAEAGIKAGVGEAATRGYHIKYIMADTGTNPTQVLTAAQTLVQQDHVFAVMAVSALFYSAAPYLTGQSIPVVGGAFDGPEWLKPSSYNMFSVLGNLDYTKVTTTPGLFFKNQGATNIGTLGYSVSPSSAASARATAVSAQHAGLKAGYVNDSFPFGSTNVAPVALAMKQAGVNGIEPGTDPNTAFALVEALKQQGVDLKAAVLPTGYGGDLLNSGPAALQAAQGIDFLSTFEPIEMNTPATQAMAGAFARYANVHQDPTFAQYIGYLSVLGLVDGLQKAGANPTQASTISALSHIIDYTAEGLWGGNVSVNWGQRAMGPKQCYWVTKWQGSSFHLISGAVPICGTIIPGASV